MPERDVPKLSDREWAHAGFAIDVASALIAHLGVGEGPEAWGFAAATGVLWGALVLLLSPPAGHARASA